MLHSSTHQGLVLECLLQPLKKTTFFILSSSCTPFAHLIRFPLFSLSQHYPLPSLLLSLHLFLLPLSFLTTFVNFPLFLQETSIVLRHFYPKKRTNNAYRKFSRRSGITDQKCGVLQYHVMVIIKERSVPHCKVITFQLPGTVNQKETITSK